MAVVKSEFTFSSSPTWYGIIEATEVGRNGSSVTFDIVFKTKLKGTSTSTYYGYAVNWKATLNGVTTGELYLKGTERWYGTDGYRTFSTRITTSVGASGGSIPLRIQVIPSGGGNASLDTTVNISYSTWNTPPSMSGSVNLNLSGKIPENTGSVNLSWSGASDSNNNVSGYVIYRYINGNHNATFETGATSFTDNISGFGQGTQIYYKVQAKDTYGEWSNVIQSATITKNSMTSSAYGFNNGVGFDTQLISVSYWGASNTNGNTSFSYRIFSDNITIYQGDKITGTPFNIQIVRSGQTPPSDKPYILFNDIKSFAQGGSQWQRQLYCKFETKNAYGSIANQQTYVNIDLRAEPIPPTSVSVSGEITLADTRKYYIPDRGDITVSWSGASDQLGGALTYEVQGKLGTGSWVSLKSGITGTSTTVKLPTVTSEQSYTFKVIAKTNFNYYQSRESGVIKLHYYSNPYIVFKDLVRTAEGMTVIIDTGVKSSIPSIKFTKRAYSGVTSGTLTLDSQTVSKTGLSAESSYTLTVNLLDDTGLSTEITSSLSIPVYVPIMAVRNNGIGINTIPDGTAKLMVNGGAKVTGGLTVNSGGANVTGGATIIGGLTIDGKKPLTDDSSYLKNSQLAVGGTTFGKIPQIGATDGVMEIGRYIDFHKTNGTTDYDGRIEFGDDGRFHFTKEIYLPSIATSTMKLSGNDFTMNNKRALVGWSGVNDPLIVNFNGDFKGGIQLEGYTKVTGQLNCASSPGTWGSMFIAQTAQDGNGAGDGQTHIGYNDGNGYSHYFRGKGAFNVNCNGGIHTNSINSRYVSSPSGQNIDFETNSGVMFFNVNSASGSGLIMDRSWGGASGTELCLHSNKGSGWNFVGNSGYSFYRVYGTGGSVSDRKRKYDIHKFDNQYLYDQIRELNTYGYRTISDVVDDDGNVIEEVFRSDMQLGCMVDELPTEAVIYDDEGGNGKAVDVYAYSTMILGATKVLQDKVEELEASNLDKDVKIEDLETRLKRLEEMVLNGTN